MRSDLARLGVLSLSALVAVNCTPGGSSSSSSSSSGGTSSSSSSSSSGGSSGTTSSGGSSGTTSSGGSSGTTSSGGSSGTTSSGGSSGTTSSGGSSGTTSSGGSSGTTSSGGSSGTTSSGGCVGTNFTAVESQAAYFQDSEQQADAWRYEGMDSATAPGNILLIENWVAYGAHNTAGTYNITATEASYLDCGFCVLLHKNCGETDCEKTFMPMAGGTYTLTTLDKTEGGTFAGTLTGVTLQEVTIAENLTTTPVPGGETWCMPSMTWTATVALPTE